MKHVLRLVALAGSILMLPAAWMAGAEDTGTEIPHYLPIVYLTSSPTIAGCSVFPGNNTWNTPVDSLPVHPRSAAYIRSIGESAYAHADFGSGEWPPGSGAPIGIPYVTVPGAQAIVAIHYTACGDESDPGPFPIPVDAPVEGGRNSSGDRHVLVVDRETCKLYELYRAFPRADGSWEADSGAVFDLRSNGPLRPPGWTSADAAGLPILPGLVRYEEAAAGEIRHAIRFTARCTQNNYVWPARHRAGSCGSDYPPMGQRFRLKASFNTSGAPPQVQPILLAMKKYGIILADNGSSWYFSGSPDPRWDNDQLHWLDSHLNGGNFEAVDAAALMISIDSGEARQP